MCNNRALFGGCGCVFVTFLIICFCVLSDVLYYIERVPTHREPVYRYVISKRIVNHSSCNSWFSFNEEVVCACGGTTMWWWQFARICFTRWWCLAMRAYPRWHFKPKAKLKKHTELWWYLSVNTKSRYALDQVIILHFVCLSYTCLIVMVYCCLWCLAGIAARSIIYLRVLAVRRTYM